MLKSMIGRSFTDPVYVSMIHYKGLGRIVQLVSAEQYAAIVGEDPR